MSHPVFGPAAASARTAIRTVEESGPHEYATRDLNSLRTLIDGLLRRKLCTGMGPNYLRYQARRKSRPPEEVDSILRQADHYDSTLNRMTAVLMRPLTELRAAAMAS